MKTLKFLLIMLASVAIAACGGGGGDDTPPATTTTYTISGSVTGATGVTVSLSGASTATTTIAADGSYSFAGLANGTYTVTPSLAGYAFSPASAVVSVSGANVTGTDFTATTANTTYSISGTVTGATGVTITLSGANTASVTTGGDGSYTIDGLVPGGYTVTPSLSGYTFAPSSTAVTITAANSTANDFVATAIPVAHSISGAVSGDIKAGVTITVSGTATATATTDTNGNYTVTGLYDGSYTLTPSLAGYVFSPSSTSVTLSGVNLTGKNFTATANAAPTFTLSGAVSGPYVAGVTITLGGAGNATTTTNASGNYSFANLPAGTYTVTPSLDGYTYNPSAPSVTIIDANVAQGFVASSAVASYSISGTVTYTGTKTGRVYLRTDWNWGTSIDLTGTSGNYTGTYTIRGIQSGTSVSVAAEMDTLGTGRPNATNPTGTSSLFTVNSDLTNVNITLADASVSAPITPTNVAAFPSSKAAFVVWDPAFDASGKEIASSYKVSWGMDANATNGPGSPMTVKASDNGMQILSGLVDGSQYYFKVSALVGTTESAASTVFGPVTIGNVAGGNTVTGTVTFPGTATGPLLVGLFQEGVSIHFTTIPNPVSPLNYTITGVPAGTYYQFVGIDMNDNGLFDAGDMTNAGQGPMLTVSGATTSNLTLSVNSSTASVGTNYSSDGTTSWYNLSPRINEGDKRPVAVTLVSGKNVAVPFDIAKNWGDFNAWQHIGATSPTVGDTYMFQVTYSDATTELLSASVSGVLGASALPRNLAVVTDGTSGSSATVPLFTWAAPSAAPATSYSYSVNLFGNANWWYDNLSSTTLQALYNANGEANPASLTSGVTYFWEVRLQDANGNSATRQSTYTLP